MASDQTLDHVSVEVADRDHGHQLRPIPVAIEALEHARVCRCQHLPFPNREALGVARGLEEDGELRVEHPGLCSSPEPPLLGHHPPLFVDLLGLERHAVSPVLEDLEARLQHAGVVQRELQHVDGLVEARVRIDVRTELHADRLEIVDQLLLGEVAGPVERHVLHEMCEPQLVVILQDGAGVDDEPELRPVLRPSVFAHEVAKAVIERTDSDRRIERNGVAWGVALSR